MLSSAGGSTNLEGTNKKKPLEGKGFASNAANIEQGGIRKVVIEDLACQLPSN